MWPVLSPEGEKPFPPFDFSPPFLSLRVRKQSKGYGRKGNTSLLGVEEGWDMEIKEIEWENNINYIIQ